MSEDDQILDMRITILGDSSDTSKDDIFKVMLSNAEAIALNTLFPYDKSIIKLNEDDFRLRNWQVRCAIELYNAIGSNGVQSYSENGLNVSYFQSRISPHLLHELVPKAGVPND